jgi:acetoacetyl-CoA synthetase
MLTALPLLSIVRDGELQIRGLGLDVHIFDDNGKKLLEQQGELVCLKPFPSMPLYFWNDSDGAKYFNACESLPTVSLGVLF